MNLKNSENLWVLGLFLGIIGLVSAVSSSFSGSLYEYFDQSPLVTETLHLTGFNFGGDAVLASLPSEPFTEIGLELRKGIFGGRLCLVASHGNGTGGPTYSGGYIPNPWNYGRGGYEDTPRSNPFSMKSADVLLGAWRELAKELV